MDRRRARSPAAHVVGQASGAELHRQPPSASRSISLPRRVLRKLVGASVISLSRKCGKSPRSMSRVVISARGEVGVGDRQRRAVVGQAVDAVERAGPRAVEHHDLAPAGRGVVGVGRRLAVHAHVAVGLLDHAVGLAGHDVGVVGQADVEGLAAAPQGEEQLVGLGGWPGADGHRALEAGDRRAEGARRGRRPRPTRRATRVGITLASVVISGAIRRPSSALRSAKLSTSPLSAATT